MFEVNIIAFSFWRVRLSSLLKPARVVPQGKYINLYEIDLKPLKSLFNRLQLIYEWSFGPRAVALWYSCTPNYIGEKDSLPVEALRSLFASVPVQVARL